MLGLTAMHCSDGRARVAIRRRRRVTTTNPTAVGDATTSHVTSTRRHQNAASPEPAIAGQVAVTQGGTVRFERRLRDGIHDGSITVTFRRWRRSQVVAGGRYRTGIDMVE